MDDNVVEVELHEPPPGAVRLREAVLQRAWAERRFAGLLATHDGRTVRIHHPGLLNTDGGPDFSHAHLTCDGLDLHGAVELHLTSSDWLRHGHHTDPAYDRVVLHVVLHADSATGTLHRPDGSALPELVLGPHLTGPLRPLVHSHFRAPDHAFACAPSWAEVPLDLKKRVYDRLGRERVFRKADAFRQAIDTLGDPEHALMTGLFAALGYAKNTAAMQTLAERVPLDRLRALPDAIAREALLFGTAGLLPLTVEPMFAEEAAYVHTLRYAYDCLPDRPAPMRPEAWQFFRLRPANFPTLRIAQAAAQISPGGLLWDRPFDRLHAALASPAPKRALRRCFAVSLPSFWQTHVRLDRPSKQHNRGLGTPRIDRLLIDIVLPALLATQPGRNTERAVLNLMCDLPGTSDSVTRLYVDRLPNALQAQGVHQLYRTRCTAFACLECPVGQHLLGRG